MIRPNVFPLKSLPLLFSLLLVGAFTTACEQSIYSDLEGCDRGVYIHLYQQTECETSRSYPADISGVSLFLFDDKGLLLDHLALSATTLTADLKTLVPLPSAGSYQVVAWAHEGDTNIYDLASLEPGKTQKGELYLTLKKDADLKGHRLYVGESDIITVGIDKDFFVASDINIREITNRVKVRVEGFKRPSDYTLELLSGNYAYANDGKVIHSEPLYRYPFVMSTTDTELIGETTLLLIDGYYQNFVHIIEAHSGAKVPFDQELLGKTGEFNLLGAILLARGTAGYRLMNPRCHNDFEVVIKAVACDCPTGYMAVGLTINNWAVHSYNYVAQ